MVPEYPHPHPHPHAHAHASTYEHSHVHAHTHAHAHAHAHDHDHAIRNAHDRSTYSCQAELRLADMVPLMTGILWILQFARRSCGRDLFLGILIPPLRTCGRGDNGAQDALLDCAFAAGKALNLQVSGGVYIFGHAAHAHGAWPFFAWQRALPGMAAS